MHSQCHESTSFYSQGCIQPQFQTNINSNFRLTHSTPFPRVFLTYHLQQAQLFQKIVLAFETPQLQLQSTGADAVQVAHGGTGRSTLRIAKVVFITSPTSFVLGTKGCPGNWEALFLDQGSSVVQIQSKARQVPQETHCSYPIVS